MRANPLDVAMTPTTAAILLGVALGTRHAFEPDHLAAVSVLSADTKTPRHGVLLGMLWGLGHTLALLLVGTVLALTAATLPDGMAAAFELGVAVMLIGLGVSACVRAARKGHAGPTHQHTHAGIAHVHPGPAQHVHVGRFTFALRPLLVGMIHGLAGSGALTAWVVTTLPGTSARLIYIALFGVGSIVGMAVVSGIVGLPLARLTQTPRAARIVRGAAGLFSTIYGLYWGWPLIDRVFG